MEDYYEPTYIHIIIVSIPPTLWRVKMCLLNLVVTLTGSCSPRRPENKCASIGVCSKIESSSVEICKHYLYIKSPQGILHSLLTMLRTLQSNMGSWASNNYICYRFGRKA